jgi:mono/diheme cytochrome c family protein
MFTRLIVAMAVSFTMHTAGADPRPDVVIRGAYLAAAGDCVVCHTREGGPPFAGGYPLHAEFGTVYSTNITADKPTGIGSWTAGDFYRALHDGSGADGQHLYPAFPYPYFTHISRGDSDALFAYLMSLSPVRYRAPPNSLIFPANLRPLLVFWNLLFFSEEPLRPDPARSASWNRGAQIVNGVGHCGGCHTPKNFFFADKSAQAFQGDVIDGWFAANLTGSQADGLGSWSESDLIEYLRTGKNRHGYVVGSMQDVITKSTSHMSDADLVAIATYLKSLRAGFARPPTRPSASTMAAGETIFVERCALCHQESASAPSPDFPRLTGNTLVLGRDPTTVVRVIVQGSQSAAVRGVAVGFSMPAFPALTNDELAEVATYIRNAWGNSAGPVSAQRVAAITK